MTRLSEHYQFVVESLLITVEQYLYVVEGLRSC